MFEKENKHRPQNYKQVALHSVNGALQSFLMGWAMRGGVDFVLKLIALLRGRRTTLRAVLIDSLFTRESLRYGVCTGTFSFLWKSVNNSMRVYRGGETSRVNGAVAGAVAGLSLLALPASARTSFSTQLLLRAFQLLYVYHKSRGRLHLRHGDSVLFALACAQIMYAAIMRPDTLPKSYYHWIANLSGVHPSVLKLNQKISRDDGVFTGDPSDLAELGIMLGASRDAADHIQSDAEHSVMSNIMEDTRYMIPCALFHPHEIQCNKWHLNMLVRVFRLMLPLNLALNIVPMIVLKLKEFIKTPVPLLTKAVANSARSSVFLSVYCTLVQAVICTHRYIASHSSTSVANILASAGGHRTTYWFGGLIAGGTSIYIEQQRRRGELALYVLPKTLESIYAILLSRRVLKHRLPPYLDMLAAMSAFSILMAWYQTHPEAMNPMIRSLLKRIVGEN